MSDLIAIIDYGIGNLNSIQNIVSKAGGRSVITSEEDVIENAAKIILPGMGHFDSCIRKFNSSGLRETIMRRIVEDKVPTLGICVGLQMLLEGSEEGDESGLGVVKGRCVKFDKLKMNDDKLKIPNMGWLDVRVIGSSNLLRGLDESRFYFAHSYHVQLDEPSDAVLSAVYGYDYVVAIEKNNIRGVQFHPEKSHKFGLKLFENFIIYC